MVNQQQLASRNVSVDILRTLAIVLMVIFHFIYDLRSFGYVSWNIPDGPGWKEFRYVILSLFFVCVGVGLVFAHSGGIKWPDFWRRLAQVVVGAVLVTAMSLVMFPSNWIYFGVLHFIVVASLLALPLVQFPRWALLAGVAIIAGYNAHWWPSYWPFHYVNHTWPGFLPDYANDWVPLIPWVGVVWLGIYFAHTRWLIRDPLAGVKPPRWLVWPGKHSLAIYLVHQPVMVSGFQVIKWLEL